MVLWGDGVEGLNITVLSKLVSRFGGVTLNFRVWVEGTCMLYRRGLLPDLEE
jgi:hypothetical protein